MFLTFAIRLIRAALSDDNSEAIMEVNYLYLVIFMTVLSIFFNAVKENIKYIKKIYFASRAFLIGAAL